MAEGTKLVLAFETSAGKTMSLTFNYAKPSATSTQIKALMNGIVSNGSIYENVPVAAKSAKSVTTSETIYDLSA